SEHNDQATVDIGTQRLERLGKRIGLVRIVDKDRRAVFFADEVEPTPGALKTFKRRKDAFRLAPCCYRQACSDKRIVDLERTNDGAQPDRASSASHRFRATAKQFRSCRCWRPVRPSQPRSAS